MRLLPLLLVGCVTWRVEGGAVAEIAPREGDAGDHFRPGAGYALGAGLMWFPGSGRSPDPRTEGFAMGWRIGHLQTFSHNVLGDSEIATRRSAWGPGLSLGWGFNPDWRVLASFEYGSGFLHFEGLSGWDSGFQWGGSLDVEYALSDAWFAHARLRAAQTNHTSGDYLFVPLTLAFGRAF